MSLVRSPLTALARGARHDFFLQKINQRVSPLIEIPYNKQLDIKFNQIYRLLIVLSQKLAGEGMIPPEDADKLPCQLESIQASPVTHQYRNKDEFNIWPGPKSIKTVGFFLEPPTNPVRPMCISPSECLTTKSSHRDIVEKFQEYLDNVSPYLACIDLGQSRGNWRRLIVRSNDEGDHMVIAIFNPKKLSEEDVEGEKKLMMSFFEPLLEQLKIKSFYFQRCRGVRCTHQDAPFELLYGDPVIYENLNGMKFQLSPESFFQVNTSGAEVLYRTVVEQLGVDETSTVIDMCSGTGTIALQLAPYVKKVYGIESSLQAVTDSWRNANLNNIENCLFIHGKIEKHLKRLAESSGNNVHVVLNPGRGGVSNKIINLLRESPAIRKLVYVSCKPADNAFYNFSNLISKFRPSQEIFGKAFKPLRAIPVDMFPHTRHVELVFNFSRAKE